MIKIQHHTHTHTHTHTRARARAHDTHAHARTHAQTQYAHNARAHARTHARTHTHNTEELKLPLPSSIIWTMTNRASKVAACVAALSYLLHLVTGRSGERLPVWIYRTPYLHLLTFKR